MTVWTTPTDLKTQLQRLWDQGTLLRASLADEALFPAAAPEEAQQPCAGRTFRRSAPVDSAVAGGRRAYRLQWKEINHRQLGRNQVPDGAWVDSPTPP